MAGETAGGGIMTDKAADIKELAAAKAAYNAAWRDYCESGGTEKRQKWIAAAYAYNAAEKAAKAAEK